MTTIEEKQAELDALQTAFDEYIVSSRELEEELDEELTKCQNDLTKAESRNTALSTQLANIQPQLTSLETKLSSVTTQLSTEQNRRISAEINSEEAENKLREIEGTLSAVRSSEMRKLKEENEDLCERLAFVEGEAEDYRNELNTEREQHREVMEEMKEDVTVLKMKLKEREDELEHNIKVDVSNIEEEEQQPQKLENVGGAADDELFDGEGDVQESSTLPVTVKSGTTSDDREDYIRTLEDELELVTEQLIESGTKLSQTQADLEEALVEAEQQASNKMENGDMNGGISVESSASNVDNVGDNSLEKHSDKIAELESSIKLLQEENKALHDESKRLKEELELALEELALSKEELDAYEEDRKEQTTEFECERKNHKEEMDALQVQLDKFSSEDRAKDIESKSWEEALLVSKKETQALQEEVVQLEMALKNSKADCDTLQEELQQLKVAYDDTANRERAESDGQHQALEELLATRSREVAELKEEITNFADTNSSLNEMIKNMEDNVAKQKVEIEKQHAAASSSQELEEAHDEIYSLEGLLEAKQKELHDQKNEVNKVKDSLQQKITHAQEELAIAEQELVETQARLAKVEQDRPIDRLDEDMHHAKKMARLSLSRVPLSRNNEGEEDDTIFPDSEFYRSHALSRRLHSHKSRPTRSCSPTTIQRLEGDAEQRASTATSFQLESTRLEDQNRMSVSMKNHLEDEIKQLQKQLLDVSANYDALDLNNNKEKEEEEEFEQILNDSNIDDILQSNDMEIIAKKMSSLKSHNAELLTRILKLQGNIQVCCRIRPMSIDESQEGLHEVAQSLSETEAGCFDERTKAWKSYVFDKVWGSETRQKDVFQDVEPMLLSVIDGYNACIFAYGQTGSGKTYTMEGCKVNGQYGINQRTIKKIFALLQEKARQYQRDVIQQQDDGDTASPLSPFEYGIEVSMLEIYNDEVYDLLNSGFSGSNKDGTPRAKSLDIRHNEDGVVEVPALIRESVKSVSQVLEALERGNANRAQASTNLNEHSSRSHMILRVEVTSGVGNEKQKGNLYLVDLAGSERVRKSEVEGKTLKEAQHINKSLSALGNVMEALDRKASHIPYRDSKLTYLLQNSLGGNSRTMMVVTVCPHQKSLDETAFSLRFATRVRRINLGSAQKNVGAKNLQETVKSLTSEMSSLSKAKERSESQLSSLKREKERVEEKLAKAALSRANSKEETRTLSVLRQTNNNITVRWQKEKNIREEKTAELGKLQEEMQKMQRDLRNTKREQESLAHKNEDKENTIFKLRKDLRTMKEQLNEEKIRHRRSQVMQSRIPAPTRRNTGNKSMKPSGLMTPSSRVNSASKTNDEATPTDTTVTNTTNSGEKSSPNSVARIRFRVLKMLQKYDPTKVDKIDAIITKFKGREQELLEKMVARYEGEEEAAAQNAGNEVTIEESLSSDGSRPKTRQEQALQRHMKRMETIRTSKSG